jgi:putative drug exporter of the RND superfamily
MLTRLAHLTIRRRRVVLASTLVLVALAGAVGSGAIDRLSTGGFDDPNSESARAADLLEQRFHAATPNVVLLVTARHATVDDDAVAAAGDRLTKMLGGERGISQAFSYWTLGSPRPLKSSDGTQALVLARLAGDDDRVRERIRDLSPQYTFSNDLIDVGVSGRAEIFRQVGDQVEEDLRRSETITFPLVLILLIIVFGSVVAAGLP